MRRYAVISAVMLLVAVFVAACLNAQEAKRHPAKLSITDDGGGDFQPATEVAPRPFTADGDATPLKPQKKTAALAIKPTGGEGDEPQVAEPIHVAARPPRASRLGQAVVPAGTGGDFVVGGEEVVVENVAPPTTSLPSVLKKKAGAAAKLVAPKIDAPTTPIEREEAEPNVPRRPAAHAMPATPPRTNSIRSADPFGAPARPTANAPTSAKALQMTAATPHLSISAVGPQAVTIGKPAAYKVQLANDSETQADDVVVRIGLPQWVHLKGGEGSRGEAQQEKDAAGRQWLVWSLGRVAAKGKEQLALELIAHQNQPFELAMQCSSRPATATAEVAVREPQVEVRLEGPSEMLYGEQKTFTLHVSNPGTGDAENVVVEVSSGGGEPNRLEVGMLPAGQQKQIPFSVAASAAGEMEIAAGASGAGGLSAEASSRVLVHKAELQVAIDVPPLKFAGAESTYQVAVANVGDALAENVMLNIALPAGAKYIGGLDGAAKAGEGLTLKIGNLSPSAEKVFDVRCMLTQAGENVFEVSARGKGDLAATQSAATQVEALADLKLSVTEPTGPVPVGGEAVYEVRIANRGTKSAERVKIVVQFAQGLDPIEAIGGAATMANGQAIFEPLPEIEAGKEAVLKVKVKGTAAGNHAFRVEVKAGEPETKLVSEGVTRCFADSSAGRASARKSPLIPVPKSR
jgi:hypothetical protein